MKPRDTLAPADAIALLEATLEASHDGILVLDLNRRIIHYNRRFLKMFGLTAEELDRVKTKFRSDWLRSQETRLGRAQRLLYAALLDGDPEAANKELGRFMAVTPEQIRRAAAARLVPAAATWFELSAGGAE